MNNHRRPEPELLLTDARGIYAPRDFATSVDHSRVTGVTVAMWDILQEGPDHDEYWDVWAEVLNDAEVTGHGTVYTVHQDGDVWLIPVGMEWSDGTDFFVWPEVEE